MSSGKTKKMLFSVCVAVIVFVAASNAFGVIVDGQVTASDNYQMMATIPATIGDPADLYLSQSGSALFMAIVMPLAYVDNTYGAKGDKTAGTHTHITWGCHEEDHTFEELRKSDKIKLAITGATISTLEVDFLKDTPPTWRSPKTARLAWWSPLRCNITCRYIPQ